MMDSSESLHKWLCGLEHCFAQLDRPAEAQRAATLASSIGLTRPIRVVVVGEFNSGKSTLVNALCGMSVLPVGIVPTTATVNVVDYSPTPSVVVSYADGVSKDLPFSTDVLQQFTARNGDQSGVREVHVGIPNLAPGLVLVDTPGVNDINETRSEIVYGMIPEADLIVFLMDIQQPLKRSEVDFLRNRILGTSLVKTLFVLNHTDRVSNLTDVRAAIDYVRNSLKSIYAEITASLQRSGSEALASELREAQIEVFALSAKQMLRSILAGQPVEGDPDGIQKELLTLVSPEARVHTVLNSVGGHALGLAITLSREIGERLKMQGEKCEEISLELKKNEGALRVALEAAKEAVGTIEAQRPVLRTETERRIDRVFNDASATVAGHLESNGTEKGLQTIQQELARGLEGALAVINERVMFVATKCLRQAAPYVPVAASKPTFGVPSAELQPNYRDRIVNALNDPINMLAAFIVLPMVPPLIGLIVLALPLVGRLFGNMASQPGIENIQSQIAKSGGEIKARICGEVDNRLDAISAAVLDVCDEPQERIRVYCGAIQGETGLTQASLQSLQSAAATLESELAQAMNAIMSQRRSRPGLLSGKVRHSRNRLGVTA